MRQILMNSSGALVARVPRPAVEPGSVLVRTHYSLVSVGTEIAALMPAAAQAGAAGPVEKALLYSGLARTYLGKAARNPRKAAERLSLIARQRLAALRPPRPAAAARPVGSLGWTKAQATSLSTEGDGIIFTTDASQFSYQVLGASFQVPEGHAVVVELRGRSEGGPFGIGLLSCEDGAWVGSTTLPEGPFDERLIFTPGGTGDVRPVFANAGAGHPVTASISRIAVATLPPPQDGLPHNEMDQQGWNVGYSLAGEVVAVGAGVTGLQVGDLVACGGAGRANHADYVTVRRNLVCKLPAGCDPRWAATTTVGTIALQGVRRARPQLGETVCVIGLGLIGQLTVQMLRAAGCIVVGLDLAADKVGRARALGMEAGATSAADLAPLVRDLTGGKGADRTIITAATKSNAVINLAMEVTRMKGTVVIVGDIGLGVERPHFYRKEIDLLMSSSYGPGRYDRTYEDEGLDYPHAYVRWTLNRNMDAYMQLIASGRLRLEPLIDRIEPVTEAPAVYKDLVAGGEARPLGVLFSYADSEPPEAATTAITLRGHRKPRDQVINFALVGAGAFGQSMLVPQMQKRPDRFFLKGVVSRDAIRGGNFARQQSVEVLASELGPVLADPDFHLMVIATRHNEHAAQALQALEAGKHVFVEKPLALTWEELEQVSGAYGRLTEPPLLMVGFNRRFSPALQTLRQALEGRTGPLIACYRMNGGYIPLDSWIQGKEGGGRNLGEACHVYDVFRSLTGAAVKTIDARAIDPAGTAYLANDNFSATLTYEDGSVCTLIYTAMGPKQGLPKERMEVFCDGQAYVLDDYRMLTRAGSEQPLWQGETDKGHFEQLSRLGDAITEGGPAPIPFADIVETSAVALTIEDLLWGRVE